MEINHEEVKCFWNLYSLTFETFWKFQIFIQATIICVFSVAASLEYDRVEESMFILNPLPDTFTWTSSQHPNFWLSLGILVGKFRMVRNIVSRFIL